MLNERERFGDIDIYLFDQLLKGRIRSGDRVLDAGCGMGRNLVYFMRSGIDVSAVDGDPDAIATVRHLAETLGSGGTPERFRCEPVESMSFADGAFTVVLSSAVLHFARDDRHFAEMLASMWRVLAPGGMFFCRLASSIGLERRVQRRPDGRFLLPDGTVRYLVDEAGLMNWTQKIGGQLLDPLKTTVVQDQRSMTTWVVRKG